MTLNGSGVRGKNINNAPNLCNITCLPAGNERNFYQTVEGRCVRRCRMTGFVLGTSHLAWRVRARVVLANVVFEQRSAG